MYNLTLNTVVGCGARVTPAFHIAMLQRNRWEGLDKCLGAFLSNFPHKYPRIFEMKYMLLTDSLHAHFIYILVLTPSQ